MKNKKEKIKDLVLIFLIILFTISIIPKEMQNDTFFLISLGQRVIKYGVEKEEHLVWHENLKYTNSYWFSYIAKIYNEYKETGIYACVLIISSIQVLLYYFVLNKITNRKILSFICTLIVTQSIENKFTARPQIISSLLLIFEFYCIEQLLKTNKNRYSFFLAIIPFLMAIFHSSVFPICLILYLPFFVEFILAKIFKIQDDKITIEKRNIKKLLIAFLLGVIFSLCTSKGIEPYTDMLNVTKGISADFISELQPANINNSIILFLSFILVTAILTFTKTKVRITDLFFILGFGILSLTAVRCTYFYYLISTICIVRIIVDFLKEYNFKIKLKFSNYKFYKLFLFLFSIVFVTYCSKNTISKLNTDFINSEAYPIDASEYILNNINISKMKIYNHFNFGSYLELKGIPAFIDSRSGVFTEEFNPGTTILEDWLNISHGNVDYNEIFDEYGITHVLLYNNEIISTYIKYDKNYKLIYQDDFFSLYERLNVE